MDALVNFLSSDVRTATPIMLAGLGILISERAGIVNIGTEGMMLTGALAGVLGSYFFGSVWWGLLLAMGVTMVFSAIFALFTVTFKANQTVIGTAMNILAAGLTITVNRAVFSMSGSNPNLSTFQIAPIPILSSIPVIGPSFFTQMIPVYIAFIMVPVVSFVLFRTNIGLKIRAVGEHPRAADTMGINVHNMRFGAVLFSGLMAGIAGTYMSLGRMNFFTEDMTAGAGFMALAAVVFGNYTAVGVFGASLIFGASTALMYRIQALGVGVSDYLLQMLPYFITIVSLCFMRRKSNRPAASTKPYVKE